MAYDLAHPQRLRIHLHNDGRATSSGRRRISLSFVLRPGVHPFLYHYDW
jgi:hypothetical protein